MLDSVMNTVIDKTDTMNDMNKSRIIYVETSSSYEVHIGKGLLEAAGLMIRELGAPKVSGKSADPGASKVSAPTVSGAPKAFGESTVPSAPGGPGAPVDPSAPTASGESTVSGAPKGPSVPGKVVVVSDDQVYPLYGEALEDSFRQQGMSVSRFVFPHGETSKCMAVYEQLQEALSEEGLTRTDMLVALGGGVTGDLTGFAAATYQRGIRYVQIPTTLLAAVDSSVGGKTAINLRNGKNQVGCFYQPSLVLCDPDTLKTLPRIEYQNGMSEVIKYGMIKDAAFLQRLKDEPASEWISDVIFRCVSMKRDVVSKDEFDTGERMLLNFGHTIGHAVESCSHYQIPHGIAVAMGMMANTRAAERLGICPTGTAQELEQVLDAYQLPKELTYSPGELFAAAMADKKKAGDTLRIVVPEALGRCVIKTIPATELLHWIR